jgi:hypothetical protein
MIMVNQILIKFNINKFHKKILLNHFNFIATCNKRINIFLSFNIKEVDSDLHPITFITVLITVDRDAQR